MKNILKFILTLLILQSVYSYRIQGSWAMTQINDFPSIQQLVSVQISDFIYKNQQVQQKIIFTGTCRSYSYELQVIENNLFIKYSSFKNIQQQTQNSSTSTNSSLSCSNNILQMHLKIQTLLYQAFHFQIFGNYLVFLNPKNQIIFKFERQLSSRARSLRGIWDLTRINSAKTEESIQIADTEITFCSGKLVVAYQLNGKFGLKTRLTKNDNCTQKDLQKTVLSIAYYRKIGVKLQIYNIDKQLIMELQYSSELDLTAAQQARQKAIQQAQKFQQIKNQTSTSTATQTIKLTQTADDFIGRWIPTSVFGIPMTQSPIYFIFTSNQLSYNGGCNTYQFQYSVNLTSKSIKIGQNRTTPSECTVNDDGLYLSAIAKINKYKISVVGNQINLKITDSNGNNVYEFIRTVEATVVVPISNIQQQVVPAAVIAKQITFQAGRYVFLILARRDLPRKFCTINQNTIIYQGCNSIQHTYKILSQGSVEITGRILTNKTCSNNNDQIMFNAFNSIKKYQSGIQTGSFIFKNANGTDIINLSLF